MVWYHKVCLAWSYLGTHPHRCCHLQLLVVFIFGRLPFWSSPFLVVFIFGRLPFWSSSFLVVFIFGRLHFWSSSFLVVFIFGEVVFHFGLGRLPYWVRLSS